MTNREWIKLILEGNSLPIPQQWMAFFNSEVAKKLTPNDCHYKNMWLYEAEDIFDMSSIEVENLDKMINFNNYTGRCMMGLGKGANLAFGHGGPGEFFSKIIERSENHLIAEYETGVKTKVQFKPHFYHNYDFPVSNYADLKKINLPDPNNKKRYYGFSKDAEYLKSKGQFIQASLNGFFSGMHYFFIDYEKLLMSLVLDQELVSELLEILGSWNLTLAANLIDSGADCIAICDDLGTKNSLLMSPELYRKFIKPWHKKLCDTVHNKGGYVHLHSHGAIKPLLNDFVDCGFDIINPFDPEEGFDIEDILRKYSKSFVLAGGMPASFWEWDFERQRDYIKQLCSVSRKYGRFILMDSGGIPENVTKERFEKILEVSRVARGIEK